MPKVSRLEEYMTQLGYSEDQMEPCPSCHKKRVFPKPDEALNPLCKITGKYICIPCGDQQYGMPRKKW